MDRVPMAISYEERYMKRDFQFLPSDGYTALFQNMLSHPLIHVHLGEDANTHLTLDDETKGITYDGKRLIY